MPQLPKTNYEHTVSGYWECAFSTQTIAFDRSLTTLLGYEQPIGQSIGSWLHVIDHSSRAHLFEVFRRHVQTKGESPFVADLCVLDHTGAICCILLTGKVIRWRGRRPAKMIGSYLDITGQKQARKDLQQVREFLHKTNYTAHVGGWELDMETGQLMWARITREIFEVQDNFTPDQNQLTHFAKTGTSREKLRKAFARAVNKGMPYDLELQIVTFRGTERWIRIVGQPEFAEGKCVRVYGVIQDIDQKKTTEETLRIKQDQLQQATLAKIEFLSVMSHEIRTPMNAVIGFTNLLLENPRDDQREYLNILKFSAQNLLTLINDILDLNKIESGKIDFEKTDFNLLELLENIKDSQQQEANRKSLLLELWRSNSIPKNINGDPLRISQVLSNLVANALKFTATGKVQLLVEVVQQNAAEAILRFEVKDTGIGIPREKLGYIFEKFTQATSETTRKYGGTGLGLAISKRILEQLGSQLKVSSTEGVGSSFYFELRCLKAGTTREAPAEEVVQAPVAEYCNSHILIVEDNPVNVIIVRKFLYKWHMTCEVAENGLIALEKVKNKDFDLVLMDIQMPEMDGYQATKAIRKLDGAKYSALPIIALTASAVGDVALQMRQAGMDDCVTKPFKPDVLQAVIIRHLASANAFSSINA